MPELTDPRAEKFAQVFAETRNSRRAHKESGYAKGTCARNLLMNVGISARVQEIIGAQLSSANITAERVMQEIGRVAFQSVHDLYDDEGNLLPPHQLPDDAAATIAGIDVETRWVGRGDEAEPVVTKKIRRVDKMAALGLLAKHFKIVGDEGDGISAIASALADRLKSARQREFQNPADVEDARIIQPRQVTDSTASLGVIPAYPGDLHPSPYTPPNVAAAPQETSDEQLW